MTILEVTYNSFHYLLQIFGVHVQRKLKENYETGRLLDDFKKAKNKSAFYSYKIFIVGVNNLYTIPYTYSLNNIQCTEKGTQKGKY